MIYEPLLEVREKKGRCHYCSDVTKIILSFSTTIFTFLTYRYLKAIAEGIQNSNINEVVGIFEELRECIEASGICQN